MDRRGNIHAMHHSADCLPCHFPPLPLPARLQTRRSGSWGAGPGRERRTGTFPTSSPSTCSAASAPRAPQTGGRRRPLLLAAGAGGGAGRGSCSRWLRRSAFLWVVHGCSTLHRCPLALPAPPCTFVLYTTVRLAESKTALTAVSRLGVAQRPAGLVRPITEGKNKNTHTN